MIQITKGKVLKDDKVEISWLKTFHSRKPAKCSLEQKEPPHPDLVAAMANLDIHAALMSEEIPISEIANINHPDHPELKNYHVTGFSTKGEDDEVNRITLSVTKYLSDGSVYNFNISKGTNPEAENAYQYIDDLNACIEACQSEFRFYVEGTKFGQEKQTKMDFPEDSVTNMQIAEPKEEEFDAEKLEKPSTKNTVKKNRKKKAEETT